MSKKQIIEKLEYISKKYYTGDFYREYFFPQKSDKIDIEIINLNNKKTKHILSKIDKLDDNLQKYFEPKRWLLKRKLKNILNK
jgi:hypothetical protein